MKCFRLIRSRHYHEDLDFLRTEWSAKEGGRWNHLSHAVLYVGDSAETVIAECGLYWILRNAEKLNHMGGSSKKVPPGWIDQANKFLSVEGKIAELEVGGIYSSLVDLAAPPDADKMLAKAGLGHICHPNYLKHAYLNLAGLPTRTFGKWLESSDYSGMRIMSARRSSGTCHVLFGDGVTQGSIRVNHTFDVKLYSLKKSGGRMDGTYAVCDEDKFEYEMNGAVASCLPDKHP